MTTAKATDVAAIVPLTSAPSLKTPGAEGDFGPPIQTISSPDSDSLGTSHTLGPKRGSRYVSRYFGSGSAAFRRVAPRAKACSAKPLQSSAIVIPAIPAASG